VLVHHVASAANVVKAVVAHVVKKAVQLLLVVVLPKLN
jgi:hypothetical protein